MANETYCQYLFAAAYRRVLRRRGIAALFVKKKKKKKKKFNLVCNGNLWYCVSSMLWPMQSSRLVLKWPSAIIFW